MVAQIIFAAAFLLLLAAQVCVYKTEEKVSLFRSLIICYITQLCLGAVLAGLYSIVKIPIGLISIGVGFFVLAAILWGWIIYHRQVQKLALYAVDVYAFLVITALFVLVFLWVFTPELLLVYKNSDPGTHYGLALRVLKTGQIKRMYFAELYNSLIMGMFQPFMAEISLYKAFILADTFSTYVNLLMFYVLLTTVFQSKLLKVLAPVLTVLYFLGWPFYSYVAGGYVYFGIGITLFMYCIYLLILWGKSGEALQKKALAGMLVQGIFGLTVCYMLFTPILCLVFLVCGCYILKEKKIVIPKKVLFSAGGAVLAVGIVLFCVCFFGYFGGNAGRIFSSLRLEGGIHREPYKDFLFLLPPVIFMCRYYYKQRKTNYIFLTYVSIAGCTAAAFFVCFAGFMSGYYYYKLYYLNWCFLWLVAAQAIEYFWKERKIALYAYGIPVFAAVLLFFLGGEEYLASRNLMNGNSPSLFPLYSVTVEYIETSEETPEMDALRSVSVYINENLPDAEQGIPLLVSLDKYNYPTWYQAFTGYTGKTANRTNQEGSGKNLDSMLADMEAEGYEYFCVLKTADCYQANKEAVDAYETLYDDGYFGLYKFRQ